MSKRKEEQLATALCQIQGIADTLDQEMMRRMARGNYIAIARSLQGHIV